jgi:hypothetical protein
MAFRKKAKDDDKPEQPVEQAQQQTADVAKNVVKAAANLNERLKAAKIGDTPLNRFMTKDDLRAAMREVNEVDDLFDKQEKDLLKDIEVRVMKYDPNGRMTDVTDRVRPGDIRPEDIVDVRADRGLPLPRNADGKLNQEGALDLLTALLGGGRNRRAPSYFDDRMTKLQMDEMEAAINEADKILEHWKK